VVRFARLTLEVPRSQIRKETSKLVLKFSRQPDLTSPQIFLALASNALEVHNIPPPTRSRETPPEATKLYSLDLPGHRTDIRTLSLSSDDMLLASASNGNASVPLEPSLLSSGHRFSEDLEHQNHDMYSYTGLRARHM